MSGAVTQTDALAERFREVRAATERICEPLRTEDYVVQSMPDVSPTRWHLAHVSWFFETFVLKAHAAGYRSRHAGFERLFNSYYNAVGEQFPRARRGLLTRPTVQEVFDYRREVDAALLEFLDGGPSEDVAAIVELGLHHEQQHQELMLMDIKHVLSCNPLLPAYREPPPAGPAGEAPEPTWIRGPHGVMEIGHDGRGFAYDNEGPRHRTFLAPFELASRPVTNGEYLPFVEDGGYRRPQHWLADGWATAEREGWEAPLYWTRQDDGWREYTLHGPQPLDPAAPVCHVSYFEADAYARWAGHRLPTEAEWEAVAREQPIRGNLAEEEALRPLPGEVRDDRSGSQLFGDIWEWTASPYAPYPGYRAPEGALGEYNGKFMCNQYVLRGGSFATPRSHIRPTYRNFFYPHCRWQFAGFRLCRDG